jgi:hypothetical protein
MAKILPVAPCSRLQISLADITALLVCLITLSDYVLIIESALLKACLLKNTSVAKHTIGGD